MGMFDDLAPQKATGSGGMFDDIVAKKTSVDHIKDASLGIASGFADIGDTILNAATYLPGKISPSIKQWNDERTANLKAFNDERGDSTAFNVGRVGGNIAATWPVGGVLGNTVKALSAAPKVQALGNSISSGGFRTGINLADDASLLARAGNMGLRSIGGAVTGGTSAALVNPDSAETGAVVGSLLPPGLAATGKVTGYAANTVGSLVKPFTAKGQEEIAGRVIRNFAKGGPTAVNAAEIVPGSTPTLAEATGNAGLATLQRGTRDLRPNAFVEREAQNAAARGALFDKVAGDRAAIGAAESARDAAALPILNNAFKNAKEADPSRTVELIDKILAGPAGKRDAVVSVLGNIRGKLASESGVETNATNLYGVRKQINDFLDKRMAMQNPAGMQASRELIAVRNQLDRAIEDAAPGFKEYLGTFAEKSKPINAMETLQDLRLTDAQGNITLAKVQGAIRSIQNDMFKRGVTGAKALDNEQLNALNAIRDDLMRQSNIGLGRSVGSNTFQNLATDNILNTALGTGLSGVANRFGVGGLLGQAGRLAYSGPNEAIRNRLVDMMLDPQLATPALSGAPQLEAGLLSRTLLDPRVQQSIYLSAPALSSSR